MVLSQSATIPADNEDSSCCCCPVPPCKPFRHACAIDRLKTGGVDWPAYGGDALGSRFSTLTEINRENVSQLAVAWTYRTGEPLPAGGRRRSLEVTPIVVNGVMYISTPLGKVVALDPVSGAEKWKYDARVDPGIRFGDFTNRGVSCGGTGIYLATTDARLIALDAASGSPVTSLALRNCGPPAGAAKPPFEIASMSHVASSRDRGHDRRRVGGGRQQSNRCCNRRGEGV